MTIAVLLCTLFTWRGDCVEAAEFYLDGLPWSDAECATLLPSDMRPAMFACVKIQEVSI